MNNYPKIIISGGGTGGHIFPAIAIANALKKQLPQCEILFVGAEGRMEMERVPAAGYTIVGLPISGMQRGSILKNLALPMKIWRSVRQAIRLIKDFNPDVVVGVGGYASAPLLYAASLKKVPYLIQEQNSYAGITNKLLSKQAAKICVAFDGMSAFFPAEKILKTGNPVRQNAVELQGKRSEALAYYGLSEARKTVLLIGGSLGARTLNACMEQAWPQLLQEDVQWIWQTGKYYYKAIVERLNPAEAGHIKIVEFVDRMDLAYAAADVIISRAGAGSIAELCLVGKPVILVPSPNVAEDHQTKNALSLVNQQAAIMLPDAEAKQTLINTVFALLADDVKQGELSKQIVKLGVVDADKQIATEVLNLVRK